MAPFTAIVGVVCTSLINKAIHLASLYLTNISQHRAQQLTPCSTLYLPKHRAQ